MFRHKGILLALLLLAIAAGASLYLPPVRMAWLVLAGRSPHCPLRQAVRAPSFTKQLEATKDRILAASRLIETDPEGYRLWQTPKGRYWIAPGGDFMLPFNLAEQEKRVYGTGEWAVKPGDIVLDCGANVGVYTREALDAGARLVVAIEPGQENLKCLRLNFPKEIADGRVVIYPKGVWDKEDLLTLYVPPGISTGDSFVFHREGDQPVDRMPVTTIDKLVTELHLARVDYIKMDIEGAEQNALSGARETLRRFRPRMALASYHLPEDPVGIPQIVRQAWPAYRMECGPCAYAKGIIRPEALYFRF
jgi:FkbM family methyltransferase